MWQVTSTERTRQTTDERHPLNGHLAVVPCLKSWKSFIKCTEPINTTAKAARMELWRGRLELLEVAPLWTLTSVLMNTFQLAQRTPRQHGTYTQPVADTGWPVKSEQRTRNYDCGTRQTMQHLLVCPTMDTACSTQDPGLKIRGSNGSKCYHVFSFATGMLMW